MVNYLEMNTLRYDTLAKMEWGHLSSSNRVLANVNVMEKVFSLRLRVKVKRFRSLGLISLIRALKANLHFAVCLGVITDIFSPGSHMCSQISAPGPDVEFTLGEANVCFCKWGSSPSPDYNMEVVCDSDWGRSSDCLTKWIQGSDEYSSWHVYWNSLAFPLFPLKECALGLPRKSVQNVLSDLMIFHLLIAELQDNWTWDERLLQCFSISSEPDRCCFLNETKPVRHLRICATSA